MRAFSIGEKEALAVSNLQERISPEVTAALRAEVRPRGMRRWLSHEILAKNLFNRGFSSGTGCWDAWNEQLTNGSDDALDPWRNCQTTIFHHLSTFVQSNSNIPVMCLDGPHSSFFQGQTILATSYRRLGQAASGTAENVEFERRAILAWSVRLLLARDGRTGESGCKE